MRVLVTGASGFVGAALLRRLASDARWTVRASSRVPPTGTPSGVEWIAAQDLGPETNWHPALAGVDVVVHLAARVHVMSATATAALEFHRANVQGTRRLAEQAAAAGVRRFVFLSSVKVHGESGHFAEDSPLAPADAYAVSKRDAEIALRDIAGTTGLEAVVIRSPLVYGAGAQANFQALLKTVRRGTPLPFASIANRRSLVGVDNLTDFICVCMEHPAAVSEVFLVSDGDDVSTPELVRRLAGAVGRRPILVPVPVWCLRLAAVAAGKSAVIDRLTGSLQVDLSKAHRLLGWVPPVAMDEGLRRVAREC